MNAWLITWQGSRTMKERIVAIISARKPYLVIVYGDKYVYYFSGDDTNTGDTWAQSYETVKKAIDNVPSGYPIHIAEGDYSAQASIDLDKNLTFLCET